MKLHYRKLGSGKPLIILHGLFGSSDNWQTLGRKYAETFTVYLVDQRNHGHSPRSDDFSYELMAEDLNELMQDEQLESALLLGHSMGGKTVMTFTQLYPEKVEKLIVADIGPQEYPPHHQTILEALNSVDLAVMNTRKAVEDHINQYIPDAGTKQFLMKNLYWNDDQKLDWRINIPVLTEKMPVITQGIPSQQVETETLFLRGGKSGYIRDEDLDAIKDQFPNSTVYTIEEAGHWLHAESPEEFYKVTMEFLEG
ncbi:MAG: alpha/beta fold hydrolase [Bacteroidota bacterium]